MVKTKLKSRAAAVMLALAAFGLALLGNAYFVEPSRLVVNRTELRIEDWDSTFNGIKVVVVSDIHGGSNGGDEAKLQQVVKVANAEQPDLIVLLGDYVSQKGGVIPRDLKMPMAQIADALAGLEAKYGVLAVLGNHDGEYCDDCVRRELDRVSYRVLENEVAVIEKDGRTLRIIGLPDHLKVRSWEEFADKARDALAATSGAGNVIALEHSPDVLPMITGMNSISPELGVVLAAHTHGGQVWLPIFGTPIVPSSFRQKYSYGHIRENGVDMFVTTGIGTSILPFRFMVPPEIAVITIRAG